MKEIPMRNMRRPGSKVTLRVMEHIILINGWEYYVLDDSNNTAEIKCCFVMGFENELGDVDFDELKPYIKSRTKKLNDIMPATGYEWVGSQYYVEVEE